MNNELSKRLCTMGAECLKETYLSVAGEDNFAAIAANDIDRHISERLRKLYTKGEKKRLLEQRGEAIESLTKALVITEFLKNIGAEEKHQVQLSGHHLEINTGVSCQFVLQCGARINIETDIVFKPPEPDEDLYISTDRFDPVLFSDRLDATADSAASLQATRNHAFVELCKHYPGRVSIEFKRGRGRIVVIQGEDDDDLIHIHPDRGRIFVCYTLWSGNCKLKGLSSVLKKINDKVAEIDRVTSRCRGDTVASPATDEPHNSPKRRSRCTDIEMGM